MRFCFPVLKLAAGIRFRFPFLGFAHFYGPSLPMDSVQELDRNVGHMATKQCFMCKRRNFRAGGGMMPGGGGGASVPSAVSGPSPRFHEHGRPVVCLDACMYIYMIVLCGRWDFALAHYRELLCQCKPGALLVVFEIMITRIVTTY